MVRGGEPAALAYRARRSGSRAGWRLRSGEAAAAARRRTLKQERDQRETPGRERRAGPPGRCQVSGCAAARAPGPGLPARPLLSVDAAVGPRSRGGGGDGTRRGWGLGPGAGARRRSCELSSRRDRAPRGAGPPLALAWLEMGPSRPGCRPPWGPLPFSGGVAVVGHCRRQRRSSGRRSRWSEVTPFSPVSAEACAGVGTETGAGAFVTSWRDDFQRWRYGHRVGPESRPRKAKTKSLCLWREKCSALCAQQCFVRSCLRCSAFVALQCVFIMYFISRRAGLSWSALSGLEKRTVKFLFSILEFFVQLQVIWSYMKPLEECFYNRLPDCISPFWKLRMEMRVDAAFFWIVWPRVRSTWRYHLTLFVNSCIPRKH